MSKLIDAMKNVNDLNRTHGVTQRGGKKYTEVFVRVEQFRMAYGDELGINTEILVDDGKRVVVKATVINGLKIIGSGMAEEIRGSSNVNKTSALENCETSAIGRALASLGLHGGSYASANEIAAVSRKENAMKEPAPKKAPPRKNPDISVHPLEPEVQTFELFEHNGKIRDTFNVPGHYTEAYLKMLEKYQSWDGCTPDHIDAFKKANAAAIDMLGSNEQTKILDKTKWVRTQVSVSK